MTESQWTAKICNQAKKLGVFSFAVVGHERQARGMPDRYWAVPGLGGVWLEFKGVNTPLEPLQRHILKQLRKRNAAAWVVRQPGIVEDPDGNCAFTFTHVEELLEWFQSTLSSS